MNNKSGFSLLSFLVYLVCFSMISLFICQIITSVVLPSLTATRKCKSLITLHIATDLFVRDIRIMRSMPYDWKLVKARELVWHTNNSDIGWNFVEDRLERVVGVYNNGWKNKKTSVVATGIVEGKFIAETYNKRIIGIEMTIVPAMNGKKPIICYVSAIQGNMR